MAPVKYIKYSISILTKSQGSSVVSMAYQSSHDANTPLNVRTSHVLGEHAVSNVGLAVGQ